jgi:hypothetical protein
VFKVNTYYNTDWVEPDKLFLRLEGLTLTLSTTDSFGRLPVERLENTNGGSKPA